MELVQLEIPEHQVDPVVVVPEQVGTKVVVLVLLVKVIMVVAVGMAPVGAEVEVPQQSAAKAAEPAEQGVLI